MNSESFNIIKKGIMDKRIRGYFAVSATDVTYMQTEKFEVWSSGMCFLP
jgi:hypothetical protein